MQGTGVWRLIRLINILPTENRLVLCVPIGVFVLSTVNTSPSWHGSFGSVSVTHCELALSISGLSPTNAHFFVCKYVNQKQLSHHTGR